MRLKKKEGTKLQTHRLMKCVSGSKRTRKRKYFTFNDDSSFWLIEMAQCQKVGVRAQPGNT